MRNFYIVRIGNAEPILTPVPEDTSVEHALRLVVEVHPHSRIFLLETTDTNAWMYSAERAIRELEKET